MHHRDITRESSTKTSLFKPQRARREDREPEKLRQLLQRKRHFKIERKCIALFHVGFVVQSKRTVLLLAWHEWFSCKGRE